jgi:hypothetical protein
MNSDDPRSPHFEFEKWLDNLPHPHPFWSPTGRSGQAPSGGPVRARPQGRGREDSPERETRMKLLHIACNTPVEPVTRAIQTMPEDPSWPSNTSKLLPYCLCCQQLVNIDDLKIAPSTIDLPVQAAPTITRDPNIRVNDATIRLMLSRPEFYSCSLPEADIQSIVKDLEGLPMFATEALLTLATHKSFGVRPRLLKQLVLTYRSEGIRALLNPKAYKAPRKKR